MEMEDNTLSVDDKNLIEAGDELISDYLKTMIINNGKAYPNQFLEDEDVYIKNPIMFCDCNNPSFVFVKSRSETCGKTDGCESGCWRIMGHDKLIKSKETGKFLGFKKILKFCEGTTKPREDDTSWVMEEYRLVKKRKQDRVICKIQLMFENEICFLLAKHFSHLYRRRIRYY